MSDSKPLVSVIIPVYNRRDMLARSIRSVLAQTWQNLEIIVVDDGSTDESAEVVEQFGPQVRVLREPHRGVYGARIAGIEASKGSLIAFNDSDDLWTPRRLELQIPLFDRPEVGLAYGDAAYLDLRSGAPRLQRRTFFQTRAVPSRGRVTEQLAFGNLIGLAGVTLRRECFESCGLFENSPPLSSDYLQWFRVSKIYLVDYIDEPAYLYSIHSNRLTWNLGPSFEARLLHFGRELARDPENEMTIAQLLHNLTLHYRIWGARTGHGAKVRSFIEELRKSDMIPSHLFARHRHRWNAAFTLHQLRLRPRLLIPWSSSKLSSLADLVTEWP